MTSDLDIFHTASVLIRERGKDATLEAAQRADAMLEQGSLDGQRVWKRVLAATKEFQRQEPQEGEVNSLTKRSAQCEPDAFPTHAKNGSLAFCNHRPVASYSCSTCFTNISRPVI